MNTSPRRLTSVVVALAVLLFGQAPLHAQVAGSLDLDYNPDARGATLVTAMALQPDGRILLGGNFTSVNGETRNGIARLHADGRLEGVATFNPGSGLNAGSFVNSIVVQPDGKILIAGTFISVNNLTRRRIARLNADGSVEGTATFNPGSGVDDGSVLTMAVQPDGKILVGGNFTTVNGLTGAGIARLLPNGTLEGTPAFNPGSSIAGTVRCVAVQPDGKILVGGSFTSVNANGQPRHGISRLHPDGTLEDTTTFNPGAGVPDGFSGVACIALQPDGKILLGGSFTTVNGQPRNRIARLHPDGSLEGTASFNPGTGTDGPTSYVSDVAVQADGKILLGGYFSGVNGMTRRGIARLNADGTVESTVSFNPGTGTNLIVFNVVVQEDGNIVLAGNFFTVNGEPRHGIARLHADGTLESTASFNPGAGANRGGVSGVAVQPDGKILLGGDFVSVGDLARSFIARLHADGTLEGSSTLDSPNNPVFCVAVQPDGKFLLGGPLNTLAGGIRHGIARIHANGALESLATFDPGSGIDNGYVNSIGVQADGKILLGGSFNSVNGQPHNGIARLHPNGSVDNTGVFGSGTGATGTVYSIVEQADGKILLGGNFGAVDGQPRRGIARLNADGTVESTATFNPGSGTSGVFSVAVQADGKILLGGGFTSVNGQPRSGIARLHADGSLESTTTFNPGTGVSALSSVSSIVVQADGKILLGGTFTTINGQPRNRIARLLPNGSLESTAGFNAGSGAISSVDGMALQPDGKILLVGGLGSVNGQPRNGIARLHNDPATQHLSAPTRSRVTWLRGGSAPEVNRVTFELSTNGGSTWILLGPGVRIAGGWELTGRSLPATAILRARGFTTGGRFNGNSGIIEQTDLPRAGSHDSTFKPVADGAIYRMAVQPDRKVLLGGAFTTINGQSRNGIARLNVDGTLENTATFNPGTGADAAVQAVMVQADGKILLGGEFSSVDGQPRNGIARLHADGTVEPTDTFNPGTGVNGVVKSMAVQPDGKIVLGGWFFSIDGQPYNGVARLNPNGTVEGPATFNPGNSLSGFINSVAVQPNGRILVGGWFNVNGTTLTNIARLQASGVLDSTFSPAASMGGMVESVAVQPDGKIVVGGSEGIFRLLSFGAPESTYTFHPGAGIAGPVNCIALQADGRILLGGGFTANPAGDTHFGIARLTADGRVEGSGEFMTGSGADGPVNCIAVQADGKILLGGEFASVNGQLCARVARMLNDPAVRHLTILGNSRVEWTLGGSAPDVSQVTFELSIDGGGNWSPLGAVSQMAGGWARGGLSLPSSGYVRARGRSTDGDGSGGIVETIAAYPPSALQSWRQTHFGSPFNAGDAADDADPELDGIENLAEFAFGLHPHQDSAGQWPHGQIVGGEYVISFPQPEGVSGITYGAEWSATLEPGTWTDIPDTGTGPEHTFRVPVSANTRLLFRLKVTVP